MAFSFCLPLPRILVAPSWLPQKTILAVPLVPVSVQKELFVLLRSESVEKNAMLLTKALREKENQRERRKYNYTLIRVRLPDENLLQGKNPRKGHR